MSRLAVLLILALSAALPIKADNVRVVVPTTTGSNYAFYPAITGVVLRLDTRDGRIDAIVPTKSSKNRVLTQALTASQSTPGRFELYPTDNSWEWVLTDKTTGEMWLLKWSINKDVLTKVTND